MTIANPPKHDILILIRSLMTLLGMFQRLTCCRYLRFVHTKLRSIYCYIYILDQLIYYKYFNANYFRQRFLLVQVQAVGSAPSANLTPLTQTGRSGTLYLST